MLRTVSWPAGQSNKIGKLYLSSMPGRFKPLETFLEAIATANVTKVLCLVADGEIAGKSSDYLAMIRRGEFPVALWRFDIPDYGMPENVDDLDLMLDRIRECLEQGESVVIHCAAGHGRTGLVATLLLVRMGLPLDMATETIGLAGSAPDTAEQQKFLEQRAANYHRNQERS